MLFQLLPSDDNAFANDSPFPDADFLGTHR